MEMEVKSVEEERNRLTELNELYIQKLSDGSISNEGPIGSGEQLLELEEATQTIARLVELLRRTEEYREYAPMMQEMGDLHYLRNILKRLKMSQLNFKPAEKKACSCR